MKIDRKSSILYLFIMFFAVFESRLSIASEVAADALEEVAANTAKDMAEKLGIQSEEDIAKLTSLVSKSLESVPASASKEILEAAAQDSASKMTKVLQDGTENVDQILDNLDGLASDSGEQTMKEITESVTGTTKNAIKDMFDNATTAEEKNAAARMMKELNAGQSALKELEGSAARKFVSGASRTLGKFADRIASKLGREATLEMTEEGAEDALADTEKTAEEEAAKGEGKWAKIKEFVIQQVGVLVFMTIPQIMQQSIQAELARVAQLRTICRPAEFGDWVVQLVDSCIDDNNPEGSVPLYTVVPVSNLQKDGSGNYPAIDATVARAFNNSISGPYQYSLKYFGHTVQRYKINNPEYYNYARFVMSYPASSYEDFGAQPAMITSPEFEGLMAAINQGYVINATGEASASPGQPPLIPFAPKSPHAPTDGQQPIKPISDALPAIYEKLSNSHLTQTYTPLAGGSNPGPKVKQSVSDHFDCDEETGMASKNASSGVICILQNAIDAYQTGREFGGYGTILPLFGWDTGDYKNILSAANFPHKVKMSEQDAGVARTITLGNATSTASVKNADQPVYQFAKPDNYSAKGCWVYACANTPFAKAVQSGSADVSVMGPYVDYVIFLDENGTQVPAFAPVQKDIGLATGAQAAQYSTSVDFWKTLGSAATQGYAAQTQYQTTATQASGETSLRQVLYDVNMLIENFESNIAQGGTVFDMHTQLQEIQTTLTNSKINVPTTASNVLNKVNKEYATAKQGDVSTVSPDRLMSALQTLKRSLTKQLNSNTSSATSTSNQNTSSSSDNGIKWPVVGFNPEAKYMVSLVASNLPAFTSQGQPYAYLADTPTSGKVFEAPNLQDTINKAISDFQKGFPLLYAQYNQHQKDLLNRYQYGPFLDGKVFAAPQYNLLDTKNEIVVQVYTGPACQGTTGSKKIEDLLVVANKSGSPTALPNDAVALAYSLITDIVYTVEEKTVDSKTVRYLKAVGPKAYENAPGIWHAASKKFIPDADKESALHYLPLIKQLYSQSSQPVTFSSSYDTLLAEVQKRRKQWFDNYDDSQLVAGLSVGNVEYKLASELDVQAAEANKLYVYDVSPSPSATLVNQDWFIAVDFEQPTLSTLNMVNVAENPSQAKSLVSLVTGNVYDMNGQPQTDKSGRLVVVQTTATSSAETLGQELYTHFRQVYGGQKGMNEQFEQAYEQAVKQYAAMINRVVTKGEFGGIQLGIYAGDMSMNIYVYFNTEGLHSSDKFEPKDLFVTVTPQQGQAPKFGQQLTDKTPYIVSLISGQVYDSNGPKFAMPQSSIVEYAKSQSVYWRAWLRNALARLQLAYTSRQAAMKKESADLEAQAKVVDPNIQLSKANVQNLIRRIKNAPTLPFPYGLLKRDPITLRWVRLAPASTTNKNQFSYTIFNVPSTYKTSDGKSMPVSAIYSEDGDLLQVLRGPARDAMMHQYGVFGQAVKTIGVPMMQPSLLMDDADKQIKPGANGSTLFVSGSKGFPGDKVVMSKGYYLYYSAKMDNYYILNVADKEWIDAASGNIYNMNGQPVPARQSVAVNAKGKADILLLEENNAGFMQGIMPDPNNNSLYSEFKNNGNGPWKSSYGNANVKESKTGSNVQASDSYTVTFTGKSSSQVKNYKVNSAYEWEDLIFVPINADQEVLPAAQMPSDMYQSARIIKNKGKLTYFMFADHMYRISQLRGQNVYTMITTDSKEAEDITLQITTDTSTNVPYIVVTTGQGQGQKKYRYAYLHKKMAKDEFISLQTEVFQGSVVVCPASRTVSMPTITKNKQAASQTDLRTYTLFIPDIADVDSLTQVSINDVQGTPDADTSMYQTFNNLLSYRVFKSADGRYFASLFKNDGQSMNEPFITYFNRNGYVDLATGALFGNDGSCVGTSLTVDDWLAVLNKLLVSVGRDNQGKKILLYRRAAVIQQQETQLTMGPVSASSASPNKNATTTKQSQTNMPAKRANSKAKLPKQQKVSNVTPQKTKAVSQQN